jgi:hypothetical protein
VNVGTEVDPELELRVLIGSDTNPKVGDYLVKSRVIGKMIQDLKIFGQVETTVRLMKVKGLVASSGKQSPKALTEETGLWLDAMEKQRKEDEGGEDGWSVPPMDSTPASRKGIMKHLMKIQGELKAGTEYQTRALEMEYASRMNAEDTRVEPSDYIKWWYTKKTLNVWC